MGNHVDSLICRRTGLTRSFVVAAAATAISTVACAQTVFTRVLLNGDPIAGAPSTWFLTNGTGVSPSGRYFAITGQLSNASSSVVAGNAEEGFHLVAANNSLISDVPDSPPIVTFTGFPEAFVDDDGRVLVRASLAGASGPGLFIDVGGVLTKIVRTGDPVPASEGLGDGVTFGSVANAADGVSFANGRALFLATLAGGTVTLNDELSMWLYDAADGSLRMVAREGSRWQRFGQPLMSATGRAAFYGDLLGESSTVDGVLVAGPLDALDIFARDFGPAPGTTTSFLSNDFPSCDEYVNNGMTINDLGEVAFLAALNQAPQSGLWRRAPGVATSVFKITRQGDAVVGLGSPSPLMGPPLSPRLGGGAGLAAGGAIAWRSNLTGGSLTTASDGFLLRALGAGTPASFEVVVREGDPAPGEAPGVNFAAVPTVFAVNRTGQMFIRASIIGGPLTSTTTTHYASDPDGSGLYRFGRVGSPAVVNGVAGVTSASIAGINIDQLTVNGPQSGRPSVMSDSGGESGGGLVPFIMTFALPGGGSVGGVFTASLTPPTPEPVGACCRGSTCVSVPASQCGPLPADGRFAGASTVCNVFPNTIAPCCMADFNGSGGAGGGNITVQDIFDYLAAYFGGDLRADINGSGALSVQDIFDFLAAYFGGCA